MRAEASAIIGRPWSLGARGPERFDCWGVAAWLYRQVKGIVLPEALTSRGLARLRKMFYRVEDVSALDLWLVRIPPPQPLETFRGSIMSSGVLHVLTVEDELCGVTAEEEGVVVRRPLSEWERIAERWRLRCS